MISTAISSFVASIQPSTSILRSNAVKRREAFSHAAQLANQEIAARTEIGDITTTGHPIVDRALAWVGSAYYLDGGCSSSGAFDSSGLVAYAVQGLYQRLGTTWTFVSDQTRRNTMPWTVIPKPGDVVVVHDTSQSHTHTGILFDPWKMVQMYDEQIGVINFHFDPDIFRICRYVGD